MPRSPRTPHIRFTIRCGKPAIAQRADRGVRPYGCEREIFRFVRIRAFFYGGWFTITSRLGAREGLVLMMTCGSAGARVVLIPVDELRPNPAQPRGVFEPEGLQALADSIWQYGVLQPLSVRMTADGPELIAGERRLRAAKLAGLREVPCLLARSSEEESALLALVENLQRRDLHYLEEAAAIARLISSYGLSQEQAAERLGKSQSAIANKLRLLRLSPDCVRLLREHDLSERHARALLRLTDEEDRLKALQVIAARGYNVAQSEAYIDELLKLKQKTPPPRLPTYIVKDVRIFLNTIRHSLGLMQRAGVEADMQREDTDDGILLTIRIPKRAKEAG